MKYCRRTALIGPVTILLLGVTAWAGPPVGLEAITRFDRLPEIRQGVRTYQASSHDPGGGNGDTGNYRQVLGNEQVMLDVSGPGCVYRIWLTGQNPAGLLRIYLDQSSTPLVEMSLANFFSGTVAPFLSPLVVNDNVSSGGFICYLPIAFRTGCRITTTGGGHYYNITYQIYADDTGISTFTGTEDSGPARALWQNAGADPKPDPGTQTISQTLTIPPGQTATPVNVSGAGRIQGLELHFPGMQVPDTTPVTDDGRAFTGKVSFNAAVNPANQGVRLVRRIDFGICDQKGDVYVDGVLAGQWYTPGTSGGGMFYDTSFDVPANLTVGKTKVAVEIRFVSACLDWNEFYYWIYSQVGGQWALSDQLDVGQSASETAHQYLITTPTWSGTRTYSYFVVSTGPFREILHKTRLIIYWDNQAVPAVDAPLALMFGSGTGPARVRALPVGIQDDRLYCYFPMPYATGARVQILNQSTQNIDPLQVQVHYTPSAAMPADCGYFHAQYHEEKPTTPGRDYTILDETGTGHFVGVVDHMFGADGSRGYLEGDERIYIDGSLTPALYGTGTEDFFNGGWYFNRGVFTLPTHGNPVHETGGGDTTVAYRFFLSDLIPFSKSIHVGIEHGAVDDVSDDMATVAFYYQRPEPTAVMTDELDVGTTLSENQHSYTTTPATGVTTLAHTYEGDDDTVSVSDNGRALAPGGSSTFSLVIARGSGQVLLRRRMDYSVAHQAARVYVNGALAGTWYDAGNNTSHRMRDSEFLIPPALTTNQSVLTFRIENASTGAAWTEHRYWAYSIDAPLTGLVKADFDGDGDVDLEDFGHLQACMTGAAAGPPWIGCADALFDGDNDIDSTDRARFFKCFSGPNIAPPVDCDK